MGMLSSLKSLDAYPKLNSDFQVKTTSGALVSIAASAFILILFVSNLAMFLTVEQLDHMFVDTNPTSSLRVNFDITFPNVPCSLLSVDSQDISGERHEDITHHIKKFKLTHTGDETGDHDVHEFGDHLESHEVTHNGTDGREDRPADYCGSCYGAEQEEGACCNTCNEVRKAYSLKGWTIKSLKDIEQCEKAGVTENKLHDELNEELTRGDGCNMVGYLEVTKVAGKFIFLPSKNFQIAHMHDHDHAAFDHGSFNVSHTINHLSFGEDYPGLVNPLDNSTKVEQPHDTVRVANQNQRIFSSIEDMLEAITHMGGSQTAGGGVFSYYTKVVPTEFLHLDGRKIDTNQFSVTEKFKTTEGEKGTDRLIPGIYFFYDFSPIKVVVEEKRMSFSHFLTQLCAIIGGVFTVAGMVDKAVYAGVRHWERKMEIGKIS